MGMIAPVLQPLTETPVLPAIHVCPICERSSSSALPHGIYEDGLWMCSFACRGMALVAVPRGKSRGCLRAPGPRPRPALPSMPCRLGREAS